MRLRAAGATYAEIAGELGYQNSSGAFKAVLAGLRATLQEPARELRTLELGRLDEMAIAIWPAVRDGDLGAIQTALRIQERRARLVGLDAPQRSETTLKGELSELSDKQLMQRLRHSLSDEERAELAQEEDGGA